MCRGPVGRGPVPATSTGGRRGAVAKTMVILNLNHGPWLGGDFLCQKREALQLFLKAPDAWLCRRAGPQRKQHLLSILRCPGCCFRPDVPRAKFDVAMAEACLEEVAFDLGVDPDVEVVKAMPIHFQEWFDLQTFRSSGIMARGPLRCTSPRAAHTRFAEWWSTAVVPRRCARSPCGGGSAGRTPASGSTTNGRRRGWSRAGCCSVWARGSSRRRGGGCQHFRNANNAGDPQDS